jgi:hypothetical protein
MKNHWGIRQNRQKMLPKNTKNDAVLDMYLISKKQTNLPAEMNPWLLPREKQKARTAFAIRA